MTAAYTWTDVHDIPWPDEPQDWADASRPSIPHGVAVEAEARRLRVQADARALLARERTPAGTPFDSGLLSHVLARDPEPPHRVDGLIPTEAGTLIVAQRKTGKTTLELNLARCLLTGDDFLGRFPVRPVTGAVGLLNFEVSAAQLARWADEARVPADRLFLVNLRGRRNPLGDPEDRARLAALLRSHAAESVIVDPFGRAYSGASQNDSGEVGAWLSQLDQFVRTEVGARDLILTAHAGWDGERTRGASALEDWADSIITMTRGAGNDSESRYIRAIGRDVELEEDRLQFDPRTRILSLSGGGSRRAAASDRKADETQAAAIAIVTAHPGVNGSEVERLLREQGFGLQKGAARPALNAAVEAANLRVEPGPRGAKRYFITELPRDTPTCPDGPGLTYPDPSLYGGVRQGVTSATTYPEPEYSTVAHCAEDDCINVAETGSKLCWKHDGTPDQAKPCGHPGKSSPPGKCGQCIASELNAAAAGAA